MKAKAFIQALTCYPHDIKGLQKYLDDQRPTLVEKKILRGWLMIRDRQFADVVELLKDLSSPDDVVESQRELVLGIAYNNTGHPDEAIQHLQKAIALLKEVPLPRERFISFVYLFSAYHNIKHRAGMEDTLDHISAFETLNPVQRVSVYRMKFIYFSFIGDLKSAGQFLTLIDENAHHANDYQSALLFVDKFVYFLKCRDFEACRRVLNEMKSSRKYHIPENYIFMKSLLAYVSGESPLYVYPQDYQGRPLLYHQVQFLLSFERNDAASSLIHWEALKTISPEVYQEGFIYAGDECLFSMAFEKLKREIHHETVTPISSPHHVSTDEHIYSILVASGGRAMAKDELYRMVYQAELQSKDDLHRLACAITRVKKKFNVDIKSRKGCFVLNLKKAA